MKPCIVSYKIQGNGPWNYFFEKPPTGAEKVYTLAYFVRETDMHYIVTQDLVSVPGKIIPVREMFFTKEQCEIRFFDDKLLEL